MFFKDPSGNNLEFKVRACLHACACECVWRREKKWCVSARARVGAASERMDWLTLCCTHVHACMQAITNPANLFAKYEVKA